MAAGNVWLVSSAGRRFVAKRTAFVSSTLGKRGFNPLFSSENDWTTDKVRSTFVDYFLEKDHTFQPSSRMIRRYSLQMPE